MQAPERIRWRNPLAAQLYALALPALLTGATAWACLKIPHNAEHLPVIWWPNGLLLAMMLLARSRHWVKMLAAGYLGVTLAHIAVGDPASHAILFSALDTLETAIAAWSIFWVFGESIDIARQNHFLGFLFLGGLFAPAIASACAAIGLRLLTGTPMVPVLVNWFLPSVLGITTVTPLILALAQPETLDLFRSHRLPSTLGCLALLGGITAVVFYQSQSPVIFVIFPPLVFVVTRLGLGGGAIGTCISVAVAASFTAHHRGPFTLMTNPSPDRQVLVLQLFATAVILGAAVVATVMGNLRRLEQSARESETRYRTLAENSLDIIVLTDLDDCQQYVSPAIAARTGWDPRDLIGKSFAHDFMHPDDIPQSRELARELKAGREGYPLTFRMLRKDGGWVWMEANVSLYRSLQTFAPVGFVKVVRDISGRMAAQERLQEAYEALEALATVDALTGVANRRRFDEVLELEWRRAARSSMQLSLLMIDVDFFKNYNDIYGHVRGDRCLHQIAQATLEVARRPADLVARFGGEEFALILPDTSEAGSLELAEKVRRAIENLALPHQGGIKGIVTISLGCATLTPSRNSAPVEILEVADIALYLAKRNGRNGIESFRNDRPPSESVAVPVT